MHAPASLDILPVALHAVTLLKPLLEEMRKHDKNLEDQIRRAASSVVLNLGEAARSVAGNRRARLETADGSLAETRVALQLATAWGYVTAAEAKRVDDELDRVAAMLWRLRRR